MYESGLISYATALREIKHRGSLVARWSKIDDDDIEENESNPPPSELIPGETEEMELPGGILGTAEVGNVSLT